MKLYFIVLLLVGFNNVFSQSLQRMPDSVRKTLDETNGMRHTDASVGTTTTPVADDDAAIKDKLIKLAFKNSELAQADANVEIAEIARKKAGSSMLSSLNANANINEFVINNSVAANYFPKYNLGINVPFDIFARSKAEKRTADQSIIINKALRQQIEANLKARVLVQYEIYKERKQLVEFQKISMEDDIAAYERAQKDFKDEVISLEELNKVYKASINEKTYLAGKEMDLNIAIIQLEALIGVPLQKALQK